MKAHSLIAAAGLIAALPFARAADPKPAPGEEKKPLRVLAAPDRERRIVVQRDKAEKETVAFLGVEATPVSTTLSAQLGLPRGTGLVVNHIVPKSAAAGVLDEHDILLKLDDQILIETRQLSVLIRAHKEGDEVTVTYLRAGQKATATIKLGKTEVSKMTMSLPGFTPQAWGGPGVTFERADVDHMLSMIQRAHSGEPVRIQIERSEGPGFRATTLHSGNSNIVFSDDEGSLELTSTDGVKTLVAKNAKGESLFSGPVNTPQEREAMPPAVRERLERLEGMHDMTFRTDGDFKGAESKVIRPRGIAWPTPAAAPQPPSPAPTFY